MFPRNMKMIMPELFPPVTDHSDSFDLDRFVAAQEGVYESALAELRSGRKRTHWIWFIFPQIAGLELAIKVSPKRLSVNLL